MRKGIILAGGTGSRLYPLTSSLSKQSLPIFDKPMIYYSASILMLAGIKDILLISTPRDIDVFKEIFKFSKKLGINISFKVQKKPKGIAEAFILGEKFIGKSKVALILGDNLFFGKDFQNILQKTNNENQNTIFTYDVKNPGQYGVLQRTNQGHPKKIIEKPKKFISSEAVTGLYFFNNDVIEIAKKLKPSKRGELEITDINFNYLKKKTLKAINLGRGFTWFDTGNPSALLDASNFVRSIQDRDPFKISCIEEIALRMKFTNYNKIVSYLKMIPNGEYKNYLYNINENNKKKI